MTITTATPGQITAMRVNVDGAIEDIRLDWAADGGHVDAINTMIGSDMFDVVGLPDGLDVFVDDEGLYRAEYNPVLSAIVGNLTGRHGSYRLHGAGVFLGIDDNSGEPFGLTTTQRAVVAANRFAAPHHPRLTHPKK